MSNTDANFIAGAGEYVQYEGGVIAEADGTKANATPINYGMTSIDTVAGAADSILLPPAVPRGFCLIVNTTVTAAQLFGQGTDTINDVATATGVVLAAGESCLLFCVEEGLWYGGVFTAF